MLLKNIYKKCVSFGNVIVNHQSALWKQLFPAAHSGLLQHFKSSFTFFVMLFVQQVLLQMMKEKKKESIHFLIYYCFCDLRPQLVCMDLSHCEFKDQQALLRAVSTLPCLRTLVLEGNPFTLVPSYPGFTLDSLPLLSCLDASWISPEERLCFRGLAKKSGEPEGCY